MNTKEIKLVWTSDAFSDTTNSIYETERKKVINVLKKESLKRGRDGSTK